MDQITNEQRFADWQKIVTNCMNRPAGLSKKQWLAEHNVPEKSYYYWQRRLRQMKYDERQTESPAVMSMPYEFAEIPYTPTEAIMGTSTPSAGSVVDPAITATPIMDAATPVAVIRKDGIVLELSNAVSDHLLDRIMEVLRHA